MLYLVEAREDGSQARGVLILFDVSAGELERLNHVFDHVIGELIAVKERLQTDDNANSRFDCFLPSTHRYLIDDIFA